VQSPNRKEGKQEGRGRIERRGRRMKREGEAGHRQKFLKVGDHVCV